MAPFRHGEQKGFRTGTLPGHGQSATHDRRPCDPEVEVSAEYRAVKLPKR